MAPRSREWRLYGWVRGHWAPLSLRRSRLGRRRVTVPTVRRIIVGVHGSLGSLQALRYAADEARQRDVPLLPVIAWVPPGGDVAERRHSSPYLRKLWRDAAWERLGTAFDDGLGGGRAGPRRRGGGGR